MANSTQTFDELTTRKPAATAQTKGTALKGGRSDTVMYLLLIGGVLLAMLPFYWMIAASLMT